MGREDFKSLAFRIARRNFPNDYVTAEWDRNKEGVTVSVRRDRMVRLSRVPVADVDEFQFSQRVKQACDEIKQRFEGVE